MEREIEYLTDEHQRVVLVTIEVYSEELVAEFMAVESYVGGDVPVSNGKDSFVVKIPDEMSMKPTPLCAVGEVHLIRVS